MGKNQDPGSGINILDPPHCLLLGDLYPGGQKTCGSGGSVTLLSSVVFLLYMKFSVADPDAGSGAFLTPDPGWVESQHPDPHSNCGSGSGTVINDGF